MKSKGNKPKEHGTLQFEIPIEIPFSQYFSNFTGVRCPLAKRVTLFTVSVKNLAPSDYLLKSCCSKQFD